MTYADTPQEIHQDTPLKISILLNRHVFLLVDVLIIQAPQKPETPFQLLVLNNSQVLKDEFYTSVRGARIAFSRQFSTRLHDETITPEWTEFYPPGKKWLKEKMDKANKQGLGV